MHAQHIRVPANVYDVELKGGKDASGSPADYDNKGAPMQSVF